MLKSIFKTLDFIHELNYIRFILSSQLKPGLLRKLKKINECIRVDTLQKYKDIFINCSFL